MELSNSSFTTEIYPEFVLYLSVSYVRYTFCSKFETREVALVSKSRWLNAGLQCYIPSSQRWALWKGHCRVSKTGLSLSLSTSLPYKSPPIRIKDPSHIRRIQNPNWWSLCSGWQIWSAVVIGVRDSKSLASNGWCRSLERPCENIKRPVPSS